MVDRDDLWSLPCHEVLPSAFISTGKKSFWNLRPFFNWRPSDVLLKARETCVDQLLPLLPAPRGHQNPTASVGSSLSHHRSPFLQHPIPFSDEADGDSGLWERLSRLCQERKHSSSFESLGPTPAPMPCLQMVHTQRLHALPAV